MKFSPLEHLHAAVFWEQAENKQRWDQEEGGRVAEHWENTLEVQREPQ